MFSRVRNYQNWLMGLVIIVLGLSLRLYHFGNYSFLFDQVQIYENALKIVQGDLSLIGPRTGPAEMFTGPLIYYINALSLLIINSPYSLVLTATIIHFVTGLSLLWLSKKYTLIKPVWLITFLWAVSPVLISLDRVTWNPNLTLLAASLSFFPLLTKKLAWKDSLVISAGVFLGYQAHFSGLALAPLVIALLIFTKRFHLPTIMAAILGFAISIAPTVVFDARNEWLNVKGLLSLTTNQVEVDRTLTLNSVWYQLRLTLESMGFVTLAGNLSSLVISVGAIMLGVFTIIKTKVIKKRILLLWLLLIVLGFSLYRRSIPEYYLLIEYPVFLIVWAYALSSLNNLQLPTILGSKLNLFWISIGLLMFQTSWFVIDEYSPLSNVSIQATNQTINAIDMYKSDYPIKTFDYDMEHVHSIGLRFLLADYDQELAETGYRYHLIFPTQSNMKVTKQLAPQLGLWIDPRTNPELTYVSRDDHIISTPKTWLVLEDHVTDTFNSQYVYRVFDDSEVQSAVIYLIPEEKYVPKFIPLQQVQSLKQWQPVLIDNKTWYRQSDDSYTYILDTRKEFDLNQIQLVN